MLTLALGAALALAGGHAVADYGLQSAYVAEKKVRSAENPDWFVTLAAHCLIHAVVVMTVVLAVVLGCDLAAGIATRRAAHAALAMAVALGWFEFAAHFAIDHAKGRKLFSYRVDQALHYLCKAAYVAAIAAAVPAAG